MFFLLEPLFDFFVAMRVVYNQILFFSPFDTKFGALSVPNLGQYLLVVN